MKVLSLGRASSLTKTTDSGDAQDGQIITCAEGTPQQFLQVYKLKVVNSSAPQRTLCVDGPLA